MREIKAYIVLMLFFCFVCQAQELSIKPYFSYHQSVSSQQEPVFHNIYSYGSTDATSFREDFTLATGLEYGLAIDYTLHNHLGFELVLGYFSNMAGSFSPTDGNTRRFYTTNWEYSSIAIRPLFSYKVTNKKSSFIGKVGPVIHYSSATMRTSYIEDFSYMSVDSLSICTFTNKLSLGYNIGLEYNYQIFEHLSLSFELGYEQYKYTPSKATVKHKDIYRIPIEDIEITYVNEVNIQETERFHETVREQNNLLQNKRLKESILFNNIYLAIGIKYNLWRK